MEAIKYIKRVEIKNLWGEHDIVWDLNQDVNVLAGVNGSGKSTILSLIAGTVFGRNNETIAGVVDKVKIIFNNGKHITYVPYRKSKDAIMEILKKDKKKTEFWSSAFDSGYEALKNTELVKEPLAKEIMESMVVQKQQEWINRQISEEADKIIFQKANPKEGIHFSEEEEGKVQIDFKVSFIKTFDQKFQIKEIVEKSVGEGVKTELDLQISFLHRLYLNYQIDIGKRAIEVLSSQNKNKNAVEKSPNYKFNLFLDTIDNSFKITGKKIDRKSNELTFLKGEKEITPYMLSSGEKQMVVILMTALIQDEKPFVMFMDEPEISLHTDWQEKLIENVRKLNENVQLIIATHSPSIIIDGWLDKVTEVSEITTNSEKVEL